MKKSIFSVAYAVSLMVAMPALAAEASPYQVVAEEQASQSLAVARQLIRRELSQSMRPAAVTAAALQTALSGEVELAEIPCASTTPAR